MMVRSNSVLVALILCIAASVEVGAWLVFNPSITGVRRPSITVINAGFGGGGAAKQKKKDVKLRPKQQWDRYTALKKESAYKVAVKPADSDGWLVVGAVKSQGSDKTEIAVARQRALIAEVRWRILFDDDDCALRTTTWALTS